MTDTDELAPLLSRAAQGEQGAFRELYRRFRAPVGRLASAFASLDADEVQDVVQETFVRAFRALPKLKAAAAFEPWLYSIARNRARTLAESKANTQRARVRLAHEVDSDAPAIPPAIRVERESELVRRLIAELPEGVEKQTVELFYVEGQLSAREIAERLGVGKSAITMRLERFRAKVKRELLRRTLAARWE